MSAQAAAGASPGYRGLTLSIFAGAFVFGVVMASLGSLLPALSKRIGFATGDAGGLFLAMNLAMLAGSLAFGPICDRFGYRALLLVSAALVGAAFASLAAVGSHGALAGALALLGLGGGALNGATNALLADVSPGRRESALNLLGIFFGAGAVAMPFVVGSFLDRAGLGAIVVGLAALTIAPIALFAAADFPAPKHGGGFRLRECVEVLWNPLLFLFALLLFFQSGNEFTLGGWISTYLAERFGLEARSAAYVLALFWGAMVGGRLAVARLTQRIPGHILVVAGAATAIAGLAGMRLAASGAVASLSAALVGLGFAPIFPTTLAQAGSVFTTYSATAFTLLFATALTGGMTAPWLFARIAAGHGLATALWIPVAGCAAIGLLELAIWHRNPQTRARARRGRRRNR